MQCTLDGLAVFILSATICGFIIPKILLIAFRKQLFDVPDERKIHTAAVPRLGGLAFMPAMVFSICFVVGMEAFLRSAGIVAPNGLMSMIADDHTLMPVCFGLCALMLIYIIGVADDLIGVRYSAKFVAQIIAAILLALGGVRIENLHGMLGIYELPWPLAWASTILLVVFITNAINLIDGIDGLASGLSGIATAFYACVFIVTGHWMFCLLAFAGLGTLVPFFYYNVFGNPAMGKKIFMGDTGSLTTGILLSFLAIVTCSLPDDGTFSAKIIVMAFAPLAIPCLDVVRVFMHRIRNGKSPFLPDKTHIHHKLLAIGFTQRPAMVTILATSAALIAFDMWLSNYVGPFMVLVIDLVLWVAGNWALTRKIKSRQQKLGITNGYE